ncbi:MAG: hypothetical protein IJ593_00655, partial [Lachnospiraceae bacterium]|nr:hypothetical protein [Lachnospiraceae bacterium]
MDKQYLIGIQYLHAASNVLTNVVLTDINGTVSIIDMKEITRLLINNEIEVNGLAVNMSRQLVFTEAGYKDYSRYANGNTSKVIPTFLEKTDGTYKVYTPKETVKAYTDAEMVQLLSKAKFSNIILDNDKIKTKTGLEVKEYDNASFFMGNAKIQKTPSVIIEKQQQPVNNQNTQNTQNNQSQNNQAKPKKKKKLYDMSTAEIVGEDDTLYSKDSLPTIVGREVAPADSRDKLYRQLKNGEVVIAKSNDEFIEGSVSVDQMFARAILEIKKIRPFYYAALKVIPRIETTDIKTMAVTTNKLYYNTKFTVGLSRGALMFVLLHELSHILMKHHVRIGGRDPDFWNIATDLFINKALCDEYGVKPNGGSNIYRENQDTLEIEFPTDGLYSDLIDTEKDTPEKIYDTLIKENLPKLMKNNQNQQGQNGQQGQNQSGQNQSGQNQSGQSGQGQSGQGQSGQGQSGQGQQGQQGQTGQTGQAGQGQPGQASGQGQPGQGQNAGQAGQSGQGQSNGQSGQQNQNGQNGTGVTNHTD